MSTTAREYALNLRVYYEDTDAGGVVFYANYLRFFERARTEMLRAGGIDQNAMLQGARVAFVVRSVAVEYLASARLDDAITVTAALERIGGASASFVQRVLRGDQVLVTAVVKVVCVNLDEMRPLPIPPPIRAIIEAYLLPAQDT